MGRGDESPRPGCSFGFACASRIIGIVSAISTLWVIEDTRQVLLRWAATPRAWMDSGLIRGCAGTDHFVRRPVCLARCRRLAPCPRRFHDASVPTVIPVAKDTDACCTLLQSPTAVTSNAGPTRTTMPGHDYHQLQMGQSQWGSCSTVVLKNERE